MKRIIKLVVPIEIRNAIRWTYREIKAKFEMAHWTFLGRPLYSIVIPCHNVEKYIDDLLESIHDQIGESRNFEVIAVDDGSEDRTLDLLRVWEKKFEGVMQVVQLNQNRGVSEARNRGLDRSRGIWVTFPDGDDILSKGYLGNATKSIQNLHHLNLMILQCELRIYREESKVVEDSHPLRYKFKSGNPMKVKNLGNRFLMNVNTSWIKKVYLTKSGIRFKESLKIAEDAAFLGELCLLNPEAHIKFQRGSFYLYRKRSDKSSALDTSTRDVSWLIQPLEHFMLPLLNHPTLESKETPTWLQHKILYDMTWKIRALIEDSYFASSLTEDEESLVMELMKKVFESIDDSVIMEHGLVMRRIEKLGILRVFKNSTLMDSPVYLIRHYDNSGSILVDYHSGELDVSSPNALEGKCKVVFRKKRPIFLLGQEFLQVNTTFVEHAYFGSIRCLTPEGKVLPIYAKNGKLLTKDALSLSSSTFRSPRSTIQSLNSHLEEPNSKLDIVLMDRVSMARDNAEALYRHIAKHHPSIRIAFVLSRHCADWDRLNLDGFNLIEYQSLEHNRALMFSRVFASSSLDEHVLNPPGLSRHRLENFKFVFLQHGVTQQNLSDWLNTKPISLILTSTREEHKSISDYASPYAFLPSQVIRTGMPRWDSLRNLSGIVKNRDFLTIAPTWRKSLVNRSGPASASLAHFRESSYFIHWQEAIAGITQSNKVSEYGLKIVVLAHPSFGQSSEPLFDNPLVSYVETSQSIDYGEILSRSHVLITDYSSIAFDAAALRAKILYFQFDKKTVFSNGHIFKKGYFDYELDGFGPVSENSLQLLEQLEETLGTQASSRYEDRAKKAFDKFDGGASERVTHALLELLEL
jgi:hypothetical protein